MMNINSVFTPHLPQHHQPGQLLVEISCSPDRAGHSWEKLGHSWETSPHLGVVGPLLAPTLSLVHLSWSLPIPSVVWLRAGPGSQESLTSEAGVFLLPLPFPLCGTAAPIPAALPLAGGCLLLFAALSSALLQSLQGIPLNCHLPRGCSQSSVS